MQGSTGTLAPESLSFFYRNRSNTLCCREAFHSPKLRKSCSAEKHSNAYYSQGTAGFPAWGRESILEGPFSCGTAWSYRLHWNIYHIRMGPILQYTYIFKNWGDFHLESLFLVSGHLFYTKSNHWGQLQRLTQSALGLPWTTMQLTMNSPGWSFESFRASISFSAVPLS